MTRELPGEAQILNAKLQVGKYTFSEKSSLYPSECPLHFGAPLKETALIKILNLKTSLWQDEGAHQSSRLMKNCLGLPAGVLCLGSQFISVFRMLKVPKRFGLILTIIMTGLLAFGPQLPLGNSLQYLCRKLSKGLLARRSRGSSPLPPYSILKKKSESWPC